LIHKKGKIRAIIDAHYIRKCRDKSSKFLFYLSLVFFPLGVIQFFFNYAKNLALFLLLTAKRLSSMFSFKFLNIMLYIEISFSMKIGYYNKN
jgi:hypothetical protein